MALTRYMFINGGQSDVGIELTAYENVGVFALRAQGPDIQELIDTHEVPANQDHVVFEMTIPAGAIYGFAAYRSPDFTNPRPDRLQVVTADTKNDPPDPPLWVQGAYATRYLSFLGGAGGSRGAPEAQAVAPERTTLE